MNAIGEVVNLIGNLKYDNELVYQLDVIKATIALVQIGNNDKMGDLFDFFSNVAGGITSALTGNGYSDLIQVGVDAALALFNIAKDKYIESWLMKVLVVDNSPVDEVALLNVIGIIYQEDE